MKYAFFLFLTVCAFNGKAQINADSIKNNLAGKEWKITQYETFSVVDAPKPEQVNDQLFFKADDMTFRIIENGKEYKGKWTIMNPAVYISCKSSSGNWAKVYKVISIDTRQAVIEYKDPDLIKTKYYLEQK